MNMTAFSMLANYPEEKELYIQKPTLSYPIPSSGMDESHSQSHHHSHSQSHSNRLVQGEEWSQYLLDIIIHPVMMLYDRYAENEITTEIIYELLGLLPVPSMTYSILSAVTKYVFR